MRVLPASFQAMLYKPTKSASPFLLQTSGCDTRNLVVERGALSQASVLQTSNFTARPLLAAAGRARRAGVPVVLDADVLALDCGAAGVALGQQRVWQSSDPARRPPAPWTPPTCLPRRHPSGEEAGHDLRTG